MRVLNVSTQNPRHCAELWARASDKRIVANARMARIVEIDNFGKRERLDGKANVEIVVGRSAPLNRGGSRSKVVSADSDSCVTMHERPRPA
jgi:hypothetical protein